MTYKMLGKLEKVDLRQIWQTEGQDFTPWLAQKENLELLGDTIGIELVLEAQEKSVGPFRADILCKNTADDQQMNRMITKRSLEAAGLIVVEASDGKDLLEIYQKSLDAKGRSDFDAIITDVNMPPHDGDDAAKEIRVIEAAHKISHHDEMPIIALSGDGDKEDIHHFFECQMTDYFIKGTKPELLLKIIANYLIKKIEKQNSSEDLGGGDGLFNLNQNALGEHFSKEDQATILKLFVRDTDKLMKKILESKEEEDAKSLLLHVHSIKGTAANIGADRLFDYAKIIEPKIKDNSAPQNWVEEMQKIYSDLKNEIKILVG